MVSSRFLEFNHFNLNAVCVVKSHLQKTRLDLPSHALNLGNVENAIETFVILPFETHDHSLSNPVLTNV